MNGWGYYVPGDMVDVADPNNEGAMLWGTVKYKMANDCYCIAIGKDGIGGDLMAHAKNMKLSPQVTGKDTKE